MPSTDYRQHNYGYVLWYDEETDEYYRSDTPYSKPEKLFKFTQIDGYPSKYYATFILPNDDILFVFDTQFFRFIHNYTPEELTADVTIELDNKFRRNPIVAKASIRYKEQIIDFGKRLKPTGWLQNIGAHYSYRHNTFYFTEYTREHVKTCNGWSVVGDCTNPENWKIEVTRTVDHPYGTATKHFHTAQEDPYTGVVYYTTGDRNAAIYASENGFGFKQIDKDDRAKWRMLNAVITDKYMWWATDDWCANHKLWRCPKGNNGVIDTDKIEFMHQFPYHVKDTRATYGNIYFKQYNAILFLDRYDGGESGSQSLPIYLYDIDTNTIHHVAEVHRRCGVEGMWGFRCRTMEMSPTGNKAIVSFDSMHPNDLDVLDNPGGDQMIRNVVLVLSKDSKNNYKLDFEPLQQ